MDANWTSIHLAVLVSDMLNGSGRLFLALHPSLLENQRVASYSFFFYQKDNVKEKKNSSLYIKGFPTKKITIHQISAFKRKKSLSIDCF